jgi:hypothetical protein
MNMVKTESGILWLIRCYVKFSGRLMYLPSPYGILNTISTISNKLNLIIIIIVIIKFLFVNVLSQQPDCQ